MPRRIIGKHKAFLAAFAKCGRISKAAKAARIDRGDHYRWMKELEGYPEAFRAATAEAADLLEDEAQRRAHDGVFEPTTYQGEFVYPKKLVRKPRMDAHTGLQERNPETGALLWDDETVFGKKPYGVVKYSDSLLQFLLKGLKPDRYRDRVSAEVSGPAGGPISLEQKRLESLTDAELDQLVTLAQKLTSVASDSSGAKETKP